MYCIISSSYFFFFNDTATTEIYTLSLHDALPILLVEVERRGVRLGADLQKGKMQLELLPFRGKRTDRKSTRLNSSHVRISYAVFCLQKKHNSHHRRQVTTIA